MLPLTMAPIGETHKVQMVRGGDGIRHHLENLGIIPGAEVYVVSTAIGGSVIVSVKGSRIAINTEMAQQIMV